MSDAPKLSVVDFPKEKVQVVWTPESCIQEFLDDVKAGRVVPNNVMIFYVEENKEGRLVPHYWLQNVSHSEQIAYGTLIQQMALEDWRQG